MVRQPKAGSQHVQSLERAFAVLEAFDLAPTMTVSQAAAATHLDRAAARRYLLTLESLGYLGSHDRNFFLRPRVLRLGYSYLSSLTLPQIAQPQLDQLSTATDESCSLTVLDGAEIAYIAVANSTRTFSVRLTVGNRLPAYCTAMGRVLLSGLPDDEVASVLKSCTPTKHTSHTVTDPRQLLELVRETRAKHWCVADQELENGVHSISVPIRKAGEVAAAMTVTTPAARVALSSLKSSVLEHLRRAAEAVEERLT